MSKTNVGYCTKLEGDRLVDQGRVAPHRAKLASQKPDWIDKVKTPHFTFYFMVLSCYIQGSDGCSIRRTVCAYTGNSIMTQYCDVFMYGEVASHVISFAVSLQ